VFVYLNFFCLQHGASLKVCVLKKNEKRKQRRGGFFSLGIITKNALRARLYDGHASTLYMLAARDRNALAKRLTIKRNLTASAALYRRFGRNIASKIMHHVRGQRT